MSIYEEALQAHKINQYNHRQTLSQLDYADSNLNVTVKVKKTKAQKVRTGFYYAVLLASTGLILWNAYEGIEARIQQNNIQRVFLDNRTTQAASFKGSTTILQYVLDLTPTESAKALLELNADTVGYVYIPDTEVNGVVVQGKDNDYYLNHNFYGDKRQCGTLFADYRCILNTQTDSDCTIIYGHNQQDGTMFGEMDLYRWDKEYWKKNPFIYFDTNSQQGVYVIVASIVTNALPEQDNGKIFDYQNYINFSEKNPFATFKSEIMTRTQFFTGVDIAEADRYLILSTCSTEWEPSRHILIARKLRQDETLESFDLNLWEENKDAYFPAVYYG